MSDTSIAQIIRYGTSAARIAFVPNPAASSQVLYLWYETDNAPDMYAWDGSAWVQINSTGGSGITELTGDVTAGPGTGSQAAALVAGDASVLNSGTLPAGRMPALTGDITSTVGTVATTLADTAVTPGSYTNTDLTVDSKGRITAAANGSVGSTPAVVLITETVTTGSQPDVVFSSISASYRDLIIRIRARSTNPSMTVIVMQYNGDTAANYSYEQAQNFSTSGASGEGLGVTSLYVGQLPGSGAPAGHFSLSTITIGDYRGTTFFKCSSCLYGLSNGTGGFSQGSGHTSGLWRSTAAITSVRITLSAGNFQDGSIVSLYGSL